MNKLLVFFGSKGNVGKSTLSLSLVHDLGFKYATNDILNSRTNIKLLKDNHIELSEISKYDTILDLTGGIKENRDMITYLKQADLIIFPTLAEFLAFDSLETAYPELRSINKKIICVLNRIKEQKQFKKYKDKLINVGFKENHIFPLRESKLMKDIYEVNKSITDIYKGNKQYEYIHRGILKDYNKLLKFVINIKK